jgi:hypothetical protein
MELSNGPLAVISVSVKNLPWAFILPVATYVGGVLSKPFADSVTKALDIRMERNRLRDALYLEAGENLEKLILRQVTIGGSTATFYADVAGWQRREVYDLALKTQPILFRELREATFLSDFYLGLQKFTSLDAAAQAKHLLNMRAWIDGCIKKGDLSRRRLKASFRVDHWLYSDPVTAWLRKEYNRIAYRNAPRVTQPGVSYIYEPTDTLPKKLRALWTGIPGTPREYRGPSPVGEQVFGNLFADRSAQKK